MKYKLLIGIFVLLVSTLMLMSNALASGPLGWINQATLSTIDPLTSRDPENSGYGMDHIVVWEEWNGFDWDIYMAWSPANGAAGSWTLPIPVAVTPYVDEIHPAVTVTNINPVTFATEVHVVYQCENPNFPGTWDILHTWTNNFGGAWTPPTVLDAVPAMDATDPAIVFTEDFNVPAAQWGWIVQFVWSEWNPAGPSYEIQYDAEYQDPIWGRGYVGPTLIHGLATGATGDCLYPEIASVDDTLNGGSYDYYFAIVWQEQVWVNPPGRIQWNIWYIDGTTTISPGAPFVLPIWPAGQLNTVNNAGDSEHPDIAATHNYLLPVTTYYFHVNWVYTQWTPLRYRIDTCFSTGVFPTPGAGSFAITGPATGLGTVVLDNPTIASKLVNLAPPWQFETWMAWEDSTTAAQAPDIYYRVGLSNGGVFGYTIGAGRVPYVPPGGTEFNPELWNKNDAMWVFPFPTHLVFDMPQPPAAVQEIEYIDP